MSRTKIAFVSVAVFILGMVLPLAAQPARATQPGKSDPGVNLALHKRVLVSSSYEQGSWSADSAVDGERNEKQGARGWSSSGDTSRNHKEWIRIDLGGSHPVGRVDIYPRNDPARLGEGFPIDFTIEVSTDGRSWTPVVNKTNYPQPGNEVQRFAFNPIGAQFVQIIGTNLRYLRAESAYYMQFAEIEVYAASAAAGPAEPSGNPALAGTSWQGEIRLSDGRTRTFTATIDGNNQISGQVDVSAAGRAVGRSASRVALQGTYDPSTGAFAMRYGGTGAPGAEQATLSGSVSSLTEASGQATVTSSQTGGRRSVQATWRMSR
jgi:hypothetical protein